MKRFSILAVTFLLVASAFAPLHAAEKEDAARFGREGVEAAKKKEWDKAIENLKKAADLDSSNNNYAFNLGLAYRQRGITRMGQEKFDDAISDFSEALKRQSGDATALRFRAFAYLKKSDWANALSDYDSVLKKKHDDMEPLSRRAFVLMQLKEYDKAIADFSDVIKLKPDDPEGYLSRANAYEFKGDAAKAMADYDKVLQLQPGNADAQSRRALLQKGSPGASPANAPSPTR